MVSIIVPTFNESASIETTLRRAAAAIETIGEPFELIVVDDSSPDGTAEIVKGLTAELPVRLLQRSERKGLASAVVDGWNTAKGDLLAVMDADLQHPPEILSKLVSAIRDTGTDIAIASRTGDGGGSRNWSLIRRFTSWSALHVAACVLPLTLAEIRDAMSGMFMLKAEVLSGVRLEPMGYKILLEVLAKGQYTRVCEVPYIFGPRDVGTSKLGIRQTFEYFFHLAQLAVVTGQLKTWMSYATVGFSGASIHLAALLYLVTNQHWPVLLALPIAVQVALFNNFAWNRAFTFRRLTRPRSMLGEKLLAGFARYEMVCLPGALLNSLLTLALIRFDLSLLAAASVGVLVGGCWNLFFNVPAIWRTSMSRSVVTSFRTGPKVGAANTL